MKRIAIFGGSFDPVHLGHLEIIKAVDLYANPDLILAVPCGNPPHRTRAYADAKHRLNMLNLACETLAPSLAAQLQIDDRELVSDATSYSYHTLKAIAQENPNCQLLMAIGWDSLQTFTSWHRWQEILSLTSILVVARRNTGVAQLMDLPAEIQEVGETQVLNSVENGVIYQLPFAEVDISSTDTRAAIAKSATSEKFIAAPVADYIKQNKLYRG